MDKKIIAIIGIIIVVAVIAALFLNFSVSKEDTRLKMISKSSINENSSIKIKLTDLNGTPIDNQTVKLKIINKKGKIDEYSVKTDEKGNAKLKLNKIKPGKYKVNFTYEGNDKYNSCNLSEKIKIEEKVKIEESTGSVEQSNYEESSAPSDEIYYDKEINVYYNSEGIAVDPDGKHSQSEGQRYSDLRDTYERWERGEPVLV